MTDKRYFIQCYINGVHIRFTDYNTGISPTWEKGIRFPKGMHNIVKSLLEKFRDENNGNGIDIDLTIYNTLSTENSLQSIEFEKIKP